MSNLETYQTAGEITTKAFDKISDKEKLEGFKALINNLNENESIQGLKNKRNSMTEEQKLKLYKRNAITISGFLKHGSPIYQLSSSIINGINNTKKEGGKNALTYSFLEQIPCRFFVELGILNKPEGLPENKLIEDVKKDAKNFNTYLGICKTICNLIPKTKAAIPFIGIAKQYAKRYKNNGTEVIITRLNKEKELAVKQQTTKELTETIKSSKKSTKNTA